MQCYILHLFFFFYLGGERLWDLRPAKRLASAQEILQGEKETIHSGTTTRALDNNNGITNLFLYKLTEKGRATKEASFFLIV
jgi:hypothetical protein